VEQGRLGRSGLIVSRIGLGTMTFGTQVPEKAAHAFLDRAVDGGITLIDTAETYGSPPTAESYGSAELIIGNWLRSRARDRVIVATKLVGPVDGRFSSAAHVRSGLATIDRHHINRAVEGSLKRLSTDYIDLYQTHWPENLVPREEQLDAFGRLIEAGKIRYFGGSNDTPWSLMATIAAAERRDLPRPISSQSLYNLLQRNCERGLFEVCREEAIGFIAFSPLAMGVLSGKYVEAALPAGSRLAEYDRYRGAYSDPGLLAFANRYAALAREAGLEPAAMAFAWARTRAEVSSVISSCTRADQLELLLASADLQLSPDLLKAVEDIRAEFEPAWSRQF
jgi:aryl-alcohol dehydrogenase-like predicted oxidoreductase